MQKPLCQTLSNALKISSATDLDSKDKSSDLLVWSVITVKMSVVEREERKAYCTSEKREDLSRLKIN